MSTFTQTKPLSINEDPDATEKELSELKLEILHIPKDNTVKADITFKLIMIGNAGVGKSCLSLKGTTGKFEETYVATVGFDFFSFYAKINDKIIRLQIWDTCGQEGYRSLVQNFYKGTSLSILVYAINDTKSFNEIKDWVKQLRIFAAVDVKMFLIGNKCDLEEERLVNKEQGIKLQNDENFHCFYETSAKTGVNAEEIFVRAAKLLYLNLKKKEEVPDNTKVDAKIEQKNVKLQKELLVKDKNRNKNSGCCNIF